MIKCDLERLKLKKQTEMLLKGISQIKGKEIEEITEEQAHTIIRKLYRDILTGTVVFFKRRRVNVCEHTTKKASLESLQKVPDNFPPSIPLATPWWHLS